MFRWFRPELPEQFYDVQSEVRPIHRPSLIWIFVIPLFLGSVGVFGASYYLYAEKTMERNAISIDFVDNGVKTCSMLSVKSNPVLEVQIMQSTSVWKREEASVVSNGFRLGFEYLYFASQKCSSGG